MVAPTVKLSLTYCKQWNLWTTTPIYADPSSDLAMMIIRGMRRTNRSLRVLRTNIKRQRLSNSPALRIQGIA